MEINTRKNNRFLQTSTMSNNYHSLLNKKESIFSISVRRLCHWDLQYRSTEGFCTSTCCGPVVQLVAEILVYCISCEHRFGMLIFQWLIFCQFTNKLFLVKKTEKIDLSLHALCNQIFKFRSFVAHEKSCAEKTVINQPPNQSPI